MVCEADAWYMVNEGISDDTGLIIVGYPCGARQRACSLEPCTICSFVCCTTAATTVSLRQQASRSDLFRQSAPEVSLLPHSTAMFARTVEDKHPKKTFHLLAFFSPGTVFKTSHSNTSKLLLLL